MRTLNRHKLLFIGLLLLSFIAYVPLFINNPTTINLGRFVGFIGLQLIFWQIVLGNRRIVSLFTKDLIWANKLHRVSGTYGFLVILLHPLIMISVYGLVLVWPPSFTGAFDIGVRLGTLALSLLTFIWLTSAVLRGRVLSWRWWKRLHFFAYILYPLLFIHLLLAGSSVNTHPLLAAWVLTLNTAYLAIVILRIMEWGGKTKYRYEVIETVAVAKHVTRFRLKPLKKEINPLPGQFAYLQGWSYGESHPFTISHYDNETGEISFSIKAVGPYSRSLTQLRSGDEVHIDGPYGVFTSELTQAERSVVAIAGGIGITPFLRHLKEKNIDYLFWGSRSEEDIVYKETMQQSDAEIIYVLSEQTGENKEHYSSGVINAKLLKASLPMPLSSYDFYICGPPAMVESLYGQLINAGVSESAIRQERFSL